MRVFKKDVEYIGSPAEIAELWRLREYQNTHPEPSLDLDPIPNFELDDFLPDQDGSLEDVVLKSKNVRAKLAEDPNYNPYGGVVQSKESEPDINPSVNTFTAEEDTGVSLQ